MKNILATTLLVLAGNSYSQTVENHPMACGDTSVMVKLLTEKYGEDPMWKGIEDETGFTVILWENKMKNTFTITLTSRTKSCIVIGGKVPAV